MSDQLKPGFFTADMIQRSKAGTGNKPLDNLLGGGFESGLTHLFYGDRGLREDLMRFAVKAQMPVEKEGTGAPVIVIDSANMIRIDRLTDYCYDFELDPETVLDRIYITRAFNASQTYELVMNQMENFFRQVPARTLIVSGLPNLFLEEGLKNEGFREISHIAARVKNFTLQRNLISLVSAPASDRRSNIPAGGKTLASAAQVHIKVEERKSFMLYTLSKHPQYPVRVVKRTHTVPRDGTLPLSYFLGGDEEAE